MTEVWRVIDIAPNYQVSSLGRVRNIATGYILTSRVRKDGYEHLYLNVGDGTRIYRKVHQYVAVAFLGPRPSPKHQVAHLDGTRTNNDFRNLAWKTSKANHADRYDHGTAPQGTNNGAARLTEEQVLEVRRLLSRGVTHRAIADVFGVCRATISHINTRKCWAHL